MSEKWIGRDGATHTAPYPWQVAQQEREQKEHEDLIAERMGTGPRTKNVRIPLYPAPAPVSRRTQTEIQPDINTTVGEYTSQGNLTLEILSDLRNRSEFANCFNLDILTRSDGDSQLLTDAGFRMVGSAQKSEQGEMVLYRRWRLNIRGE
jgi:hypothetical protein